MSAFFPDFSQNKTPSIIENKIIEYLDSLHLLLIICHDMMSCIQCCSVNITKLVFCVSQHWISMYTLGT